MARCTWPIDAAASACSSKSAKTRLSGPPSSLRSNRSRSANAHRRDVVAERGELALQSVALVLGQAVELDHREHLPDLHRRAAHLAELLDELLDERRGPLALRRGRALGRADAVGGPHPGPAQALAGHQPADARGPRDPAGRQLARLARLFLRLARCALRLAG